MESAKDKVQDKSQVKSRTNQLLALSKANNLHATHTRTQQQAKHMVKETCNYTKEKLAATPQSAREYKKDIKVTTDEAMKGLSVYVYGCVPVWWDAHTSIVWVLSLAD